MNTKLCLSLIAILMCGSTALAAPTLRGDVTVNKAIVTIGDMFDDAGALAETGIFLAPRPGTTGIVALADVQRAAALVGLTQFENIGFTRVRVVRESTFVDEAMLDGLVAADLERRGMLPAGLSAEIRFDVAELGFNAEAVANPASIVALRYAPATGDFTARFTIAGLDQPIDLNGSIELMTTAPRLIGNKPAGTILTEGDFETTAVAVATADAGDYADLADLVGKQLMRSARAGMMLRSSDVGAPVVVTRNSLVTVILKSGPMTLTVRGTALTAAAAGEPVDVLNAATKKILHGVARADGAVEIVTATAVAGL